MIPTSVENFKDLYTGDQITVYIVVSLVNALILFFASMKFILVLQQCGYRGKRYFKWLSHKETPYLSRLMLLCLLGLLFFCVINICFSPLASRILGNQQGQSVASYLGFLSYLLFSFLYIMKPS